MHENYYGFYVGGPVWIPKIYPFKDKTFFYVGVEPARLQNSFGFRGIFPTPDELAGHLNNSLTLLNQSVLLRGVNDSADVLATLSNALFDAGILPYYIHVLDKVQGAAHFMVNDDEARVIMKGLMSKVSGYMVPKLTREIGGEPSKTILDLRLKQS